MMMKYQNKVKNNNNNQSYQLIFMTMETKNFRQPIRHPRKLLALLVIFLLGVNLQGFAQAPPIPGGGKLFTITVNLEGLYNTTTHLMNKAQDFNTIIEDRFSGVIVDQVTVELHTPGDYATEPEFPNKQENMNLLDNGKVYINLPLTGTYYLTIKNRNHLETVSALPINLATTDSYDFTTAATQAYGNNQKMLETGVYGIYLGDVNQDGSISLTDRELVNSSFLSGQNGYLNQDIDGNGSILLTDREFVQSKFLFGNQIITP
jgi:hypothetical protein